MPEKKPTKKSSASKKKKAEPKPVELELSPAQERRLKGIVRMMPARPGRGPVSIVVDPTKGRLSIVTPKREHRIGPQGGEW
jgi:hypothetical protein